MGDFEKLGVFYLGRRYDEELRKSTGELLLYDSKDLVTHAVCFGMTGSGKTGLCVGLLEEAAIDAIPALVIDPKGDLVNLLLAFPDLRAEDFRPWINEDDARRNDLSADAYAARQAELWRRGLSEWGQGPGRIQRLRQAADFAVYTPGSNAGLQVSVVKSFAAPPSAIREDRELMRERITATVTALLGLMGIDADPLQSREHILLSTLLDTAWRQGQDLDLPALIQQVQKPPAERIGVLDLESFYPAKERFGLATLLNNLLASPGFEAWMQGEPLDIQALLYTPDGRPRVSIFSIAHLSDAERMFFVSLLLNQTLSWMRLQSGTTSLRALLYMDEIFGYFPPVANPSSKTPLLTLLKQARAFGLGVVLATQNPVDLDYKGLANAGTWFIGRLQTERDKARVLDGLEGAATGAGARFDRQRAEQILAGLGNRVFLMNNVHEDAPVAFETRWTLSYLRGPLTRAQIKALMDPRKTEAPPPAAPSPVAAPRAAAAGVTQIARPVLPPDVPQFFLPHRAGGTPVYRPTLLGSAQIRFVDTKARLAVTWGKTFLTPIHENAVPVNWEEAVETDADPAQLEAEPIEPAGFAELPAAAGKPKNYAAWSRDFANWLYANQKLELLRSPSLKLISEPGEAEGDFRIRLQQASREERDRQLEKLRQNYAPKVAALQERIRRAEQALEREQQQAQDQKAQTALSIGATLLGAVFGRKLASAGNIGRAATAARSVSRSRREAQDVARAAENVDVLRRQLGELEAQFQAEAAALAAQVGSLAEPLETVTIRPKKTHITVQLVALVWNPFIAETRRRREDL